MGSRLLELQSSGDMAVIDNITGWPRRRAAQVRIQGRVFSCALYCPNLSLALLSAHSFRTLHNHHPGCVIRNHGLLHLGSSLGGCCPFSDSQCSSVPSQGGKVLPGSYLLSHTVAHMGFLCTADSSAGGITTLSRPLSGSECCGLPGR